MSLRKIVLLLAAGFSTGVVMTAAFGQMGARRRDLLYAYGATACVGRLDAP